MFNEIPRPSRHSTWGTLNDFGVGVCATLAGILAVLQYKGFGWLLLVAGPAWSILAFWWHRRDLVERDKENGNGTEPLITTLDITAPKEPNHG